MPRPKRAPGNPRTRLQCAAANAIEQLEARRLLCFEHMGEPEEVHFYNSAGEHLNLIDPGLIDIPSASSTSHSIFETRTGLPDGGVLPAMGPEPVGLADGATAMASDGFEIASAAPGLTTTAQTFSGTLNGKFVFTSGGHGFHLSSGTTTFDTDRPEYWRQADGTDGNIVEDLGTQDQLTLYADYLLRAGATVIPMRPVGRQINEVVLDNDSAGVTFTGSWSNSGGTQFYDEDYGSSADAIPYKFASTTTGAESAVATYTPNISQAGFYPVYTWAARGTNRTSQLYRVNHTGGSTEIRVDHSKVGFGWVYLGTYHFNAGSSVTEGAVEISNNAAVTGKVVIADAIRFGNGMGDYIESGATVVSGKPREDEYNYYWVARMVGQGTTLDTAIGVGTTNVSSPSNMAQWMFSGAFGEAVYVGFHSNGTTGDPDTATGRGARGLIDSTSPTPHQAGTNGLADILGDQINLDFQALNGVYEVNWTTGTTATGSGAYGEINLGSAAEMDATIIEVAFHDNVNDNLLLRDPRVREQIARSTYQGTLQYFSLYGSPLATNTSLPTPPASIRAVSNAGGQVTLSWAAGPTSPAGVYGAAATGYKVYASTDGYGFDGGTAVAGTSVTLTGFDANTTYYFKVAATNAGGESRASEVVAALPSGGAKNVLIVNGFDRFDRTQNFRFVYPDSTNDGLTDRVWTRYNNSFDYINRVASAIQSAKPGTHVASTSNEAVISGAVNLTDYDTVVWILGNESTANDTFDATEQSKVITFLSGGGNLFVSGSEVAFDLDQQNNGRTFYENTLKGNYVGDDAGTHTTTADAGSIFSTLASVVFSSGASSTLYSTRDDQVYDVTSPDVISPQAGAISALTYSGGTGGSGAITVRGTGGAGSVVMFGFPFETMTSATRRQQVMGRVLDFFTPTGVPVLLAASDTGTSSSDRITKNANGLQFTVSGTTGTGTVTLYRNGVAIGSAPSVAGTTTVTTTSALPEGASSIIARQGVGGSETADSGSVSVTIDTTAPTAAVGPQQPTPGSVNFDFSVTYADTNGVNAATFDGSDVTVTGPNSFSQTASFVSAVGNVVTYRITAPGGSWNFGDNGSYTVAQNANQVGDIAGNNRSAGSIGSINVAVPFAWVASNVLHVENGSSTLAVNGANLDVTQGSTLSFGNGNFSSIIITGRAVSDSMTFSGAITQPVTYLGGGGLDQLKANSGSIALAADAGADGSVVDVLIDASATATFNSTQHLNLVQVDGNATLAAGGNKVVVAKSLTVSGRLDLKDNDLIWDYSGPTPLGTFSGGQYTGAIGLVATGRNGGSWNGNGVVTSMSDAVAPQFKTTIAVAEASDLPGISPFAGETLDGTAIVFKYTYAGDANLDGVINGDDFFRIDNAFPSSGSVFGQSNGDFDLNGSIDSDDYFLIDSNYGNGQVEI